MNLRKMGWKRDLPDVQDFKYAVHPEMQLEVKLPALVDLRSGLSPVENQGQLGSCVANATTGALEYLQLDKINQQKECTDVCFIDKYQDISRLYIYFNARYLDGHAHEDSGTYIKTAMKAIKKWGICRESLWPYRESRVFQAPDQRAYVEGANHLIFNYYKLDHTKLNELKQCLALRQPFIFGMSLYSSFMSQEVSFHGMIPMPLANDRFQGGHAMCCVGYDDSKQAFIVRNSWGNTWGDDGYCYIPYNYLCSADLAADFWTLRKDQDE